MGEPLPLTRPHLSLEDYVAGVRAGDRAVLGRAITMLESNARAHTAQAEALLGLLMPYTGGAHRVAISGTPGAGKSTLIDSLGRYLIGRGHRVAVLAVDPSSTKTGGSILGDKTRMGALALDPNAFIRPSPTGGTLGGVARSTREALLLCEAAGYDWVLVETVGVGQSEAVVAGMVDTFLLLLLGGAGDELQGIKRGIVEHADVVAINKADGENMDSAEVARYAYQAALGLSPVRLAGWRPPVVTCSGLHARGIDELVRELEAHRRNLRSSGVFDERRASQRRAWMWETLESELLANIRRHRSVAQMLPSLESAVVGGEMPVRTAARRILAALDLDEP